MEWKTGDLTVNQMQENLIPDEANENLFRMIMVDDYKTMNIEKLRYLKNSQL